jgi:hypothetical protein
VKESYLLHQVQNPSSIYYYPPKPLAVARNVHKMLHSKRSTSCRNPPTLLPRSNTLSTMAVSISLEQHRQWLAHVQQQYEAHREAHEQPASAFGLAPSSPTIGTGGFASCGVPSPMPSAPMMWGMAEEANEPAYGDELDAGCFEDHVYRSAGSFFNSAEFVDDVSSATWDEEPVYRSLDLAGLTVSESEASAPAGDWLDTMPPLLCRQRGGVLA